MAVNFFGRFLVQEGIITETQLDDALACQGEINHRLGDFAMARGDLSAGQVQRIFDEQRTVDLPFGEMAVRLGFLTRETLAELLFAQQVHCARLGEVLIMLEAISVDQYSQFMTQYYQQEGRRRLNLRYLLDELEEGRILPAAVHALQNAFPRFGGGELKPGGLAGKFEPSLYAVAYRVVLSTRYLGRVEAVVCLAEDAALDIAAAMAGPEAGPGVVGGALGEFFDVFRAYYKSALERRGSIVLGQSLQALAEVPQDLASRGMLLELSAPAGPVVLAVWTDGVPAADASQTPGRSPTPD